MLKKMKHLTKLAKKAKAVNKENHHHHHESLYRQGLIRQNEGSEIELLSPIPLGFFAVYVGEERERFVVPTAFLSHPLFKILLEKAYDEFGFQQKRGIVVPCTVSTFQELLNAVETNHGRFDMANFFQELA